MADWRHFGNWRLTEMVVIGMMQWWVFGRCIFASIVIRSEGGFVAMRGLALIVTTYIFIALISIVMALKKFLTIFHNQSHGDHVEYSPTSEANKRSKRTRS